MAHPFRERRRALAELGIDLSPAMVAGTAALSIPEIDPAIFDGVRVVKDVAYGAHERHVLDIYLPDGDVEEPRPVLLYVHGGGFVRGAKDSDTTPFFANIGSWAVQQGWVAVIMNYRLAPEARYPAGAEDIAAAVTWISENIAAHGGDATRLFLSGQSAGSMHVADYVVGHGGFGPQGHGLAGAIIVSCIYDVARATVKDLHTAYWGEDTSQWRGYATLQGLIDTDIPLLLAVCEMDEPEFQDHAAQLVSEWHAQRGTYAPMHYLYGQNHLTPVYGIGSPWDDLGPKIQRFIEANG